MQIIIIIVVVVVMVMVMMKTANTDYWQQYDKTHRISLPNTGKRIVCIDT
jgi:hypothetical protein